MECCGPFIIMRITIIVLGIVFITILRLMSKGVLRELIEILAIIVIVAGALLSLQIGANIWGY
ncbi:hypothetical protein SAMN04488134_101310 [Amphibacillus marinus]|uniref:Uncharacterized protein n=1 Tax=Amphibacillus marinus TaxID=872970 RepID=A0A1H8HCD5_9BACI|nr:hypothetical protein SAMN04488134_101310 [Amphibacillus marinus]